MSAAIFTFTTSAANTTVNIPLFSSTGTSVTATIVWGDGITNTNISSTTGFTHVFVTIGTYSVNVTSSTTNLILGINDGSSWGDNSLLKSCTSFGSLTLISLENAFNYCSNLSLVPSSIPTSVTSTANMFNGASAFNQNIGSWNTSNVTNMSGMFQSARNFNQNIGSWNTIKVTNMSYMFNQGGYNGSAFNNGVAYGVVSAINWNTSNVTDMSHMFRGTPFNQDISKWDTSKVTNMTSMFQSCGFQKRIDTSGNYWNVNKVTSMNSMFYASSFNQDISGWILGSCTDMYQMFRQCNGGTMQNINWDCSGVQNMANMFWNFNNFNANITSWNTRSVTNMSYMFNGAYVFNQNIGNWNTSNVTNMTGIFLSAQTFNQNIGNWNTSKVTTMESMFNSAAAFNQPIGNWNTSNVTNMYRIFQNAVAFNQNISNWNISKIDSMDSMFSGATAFNKNIGSWNTSNVNNMKYVFYNATAFNQNIGNWNTSNVTIMDNMFNGAQIFDQNIGNWNISKVTSMSNFLTGNSAMSVDNFNKLLIGWASQIVIPSVVLSAPNLKYNSIGQTAYSNLTNASTNNWQITTAGITTKTIPALSFNIPNRLFGGSTYTITQPTSNNIESGGTFTYTSSDTSIASISGNVITIIGDGTVTITATQAETTNYVKQSVSADVNIYLSSSIICTFTTSAANTTIKIPLFSSTGASVTATIVWGDGVTSTNISSTTGFSHVFVSIGTYTINITSSTTNLILGQNNTTSWGDNTKLTLLNSYGNLNLVSLAYAFNGCSNLTKVPSDFPSTVTTIGPNTFLNCSLLTSVVMSSTVINIDSSTFQSCSGLTTITIPSLVTNIGASAFQSCSGLTTITIPSLVTNIGASAFQSCTGLTTITIPSVATSIGSSAFQSCTNLLYMSLPGSVTNTVSSFLSTDASSVVLTNNSANGITYTIANGQATVSSYSTAGTSASIPIYVTSNSIKYPVTSIVDNAFYNKSLTSVIIPPFITSIGTYAFYNNQLTSINLPPGLTSIGTHCFENNLITSAYFPSGLTSIPESIMQNNRLISINMSPNLITIGNYAFAFNYINTINNSTTPTLPASLTSIGQYAFKSNQLSNLTLPTNGNFTTLADGVFSSNLLQTIRVPNNVTTVGIEVFRNNNLTSFDISLTAIPNSMFRENKFTTITIPSQITSIGYGAFMSCTATSITFASLINLKRIDEFAFQSNQFQSINLPTSITFIGNSTFSLGALTSVTIPSNVAIIDNAAFSGNKLTSVSFTSPSNITYLSSSVFADNSLNSITIPSSVTSIGQYALNNNRLTFVSIPPSVTSIGNYSFANNLLRPIDVSMVNQTTITSIGYAAFYNNASITVTGTPTAIDSSGINYSSLSQDTNGNYITQISSYTGSSTSVIIPFTITNTTTGLKYNVTSIANGTNANPTFNTRTLTSVTLNMNINSIGQFAFANNNLTSIIIPNSVTAIGDAAFYTNRLTSINISTNVSYLGGSLFQLNNLTNVTIPPNVTGLVDFVFADNLLTSINIPSSIVSIPFCAFRNNRLTSIDLSNTSIIQIANAAFQINTITQLSIPSRITSIGNSAFQNNRLSSVVFNGTSSITTISDYVFADNSLNTISIPSSITTIGNNALQNNFLTSIQLPANLVYIGQYAFQNNRLQSAITIPATVNYIGDNAFATNQLSKTIDTSANGLITFSGNNQTIQTTLGGNIFNNNTTTNQKVYITYAYGKKWASTTTTLSNPLVPLSSSFDISTNNIQIIIQKATLTPIISVQNKVYDGSTNAIGTFSVIPVGTDTVTLTGIATFVDRNAGQTKTVNITNLLLSGASSGNYTLANTTTTSTSTITPKTVTPVITVNPKIYDTTTTASFLYSLPDILTLDNNNITMNGTASFVDSSAGQNKSVNVTGIVLLGDASSNYQLSSSTITTTGTITKKYIYFSIPNKTYDGSSTIVKYDLSGVYASDASFVSASGLIYFSTATVGQDIPINTNTITLNGSKSSNYDAFYLNNPPYTSSLSRVTGNIVQKALDISSAFTKIYDATINYTNRIDLSGVVQSDINFVDFSYTIVASYDVSSVSATKVTISNISLKGVKSANYSINQTIDVSGRILPKPLDISATIVKVYDGSINTYNNRIDLSGVIPVDNGLVDISYSLPLYDTANVGTNKTVTITNARLTGIKLQNYSINSSLSVSGIINKKILDVSASAIAKVYDKTTNINFIVDLSGVLSGDNVSAAVTGNVSSPNVGTYSSLILSDFVLSGAKSGNYDISSSSVIQLKNSAIITRKYLTASANVIDKTYSGDVSANVNFILNGVLTNDTISVSNNYIAKYRNATVGQNKPVDISNITLTGISPDNYDVSSTLLLYGNILKKSIDVSCNTITKIYDGSRNATSVPIFLTGTLDTSTNVTFTSANFNTASAGTNKQVTITGISIYGDTSSNYNLSYNTLIVNGTINPKPLTIVSNGITRPYDSTNNASVIVSIPDKLSSDSVNVSYTSSQFSDSHVGQNKTITISGIALTGISANNYNINSSASATASITPYILNSSNLTGIVSTKVYDDTNPSDMSATVQLYLNNIIPSDQNNLFVNYASAVFQQNGATVYNNTNKLNVRVDGLYLSGSAATDYSLNITRLDLSGSYVNIIQTPLRIILNDSSINKIYDATTRIDVSLSLYNDASNIIPSNVAINYVSSNFDNKNVGSNKNINITGIYLTGTDSFYYKTDSSLSTLSLPALKGRISKKNIDISRNPITKYYDANQYSYNIPLDLSGIVTGDSISCRGDANFISPSIGQKTVNVANIRLIGDSSMNYDLSSTSIVLSGDINRKIVTVSASKIYDGSNTVYQSDLSLSGIIQNEIVAINASGEYSQITPGTINANLRNVSLSGTNSGNYNLNYDVSNSITSINAIIYPKQLGITISKVYDGSTNIISTNVVLNSMLNNENVYYGGTGNFADASAGTNIPATISTLLLGNDRYNYIIDVSGVTGTISRKPVNVVVSTITYNGSNLANIDNFSITNSLVPNDIARVYLTKSSQTTFYYDSSQAGNRYILNASGNLFIAGDLSKNYILDNTQTINAIINRRGIDLSANNKVYDGSTNYNISNIILNNKLSGDDISLNAIRIYCDESNAVDANVYILDASLIGLSSFNYSINPTYLINNTINKIPMKITKRPITVRISPKIYDATTTLYDTNISLNNVIPGDNVNVSGRGNYDSSFAGNRIVTYTVSTLFGTSYTNYEISSNQSIDAVITRRQAGLTILPRYYDGSSTVYLSDFSLNNILQVDVSNIIIIGAGTYDSKRAGNKTASLYDLSFSGPASPNYDISATIQLDVSINRLPALLAASSKIYDATPNLYIRNIYVKNKITNDKVDVSANGTYDSSFVGNRTVYLNTISLYGSDSSNYIVATNAQIDGSINPHPLTIIVNDKIYDGTTRATDLSLNGVYQTDTNKVSINGYLLYKNSIAKTNKIVDISNNLQNVYLTGDYSFNYYIFNNIYTTGNVYPRPVTIIPSAINKTYDRVTDANVHLDISGLVTIDNGQYFANYDYANYDNILVGQSKQIVIKNIYINGPYVENYTYTPYLTTTGNILPARLTISATPQSKDYDNTSYASAIYSLNGVFENDIVTVTGDAYFNDKNAAINKPVTMTNFVLTGNSLLNYYLDSSLVLHGSADIYPAKLIPIKTTISTKTYDGSRNTTGTIDLSGIISNNQVSANGTFSFITSDVANNKPVIVKNIYLIGADASNYELSFNDLSGISNIQPLQLTILPYTKPYDGTTYVDISNIQVAGVLSNEIIHLGGSAVFDSPFVGTRNILINGAYLLGNSTNNYTIQSQQTVPATITKSRLTISINDKIYDASNGVNISNVTLNGIQNNNAISISSITGTYSNAGNAGNNIRIDVSSVVISGDLSSQYDISGTGIVYGNIIRKPLTVSATAMNKLYDGLTAADANVVITSGIIPGDIVFITSFAANFDTPDIGDNKTVNITNIQLGGPSSHNYTVSSTTTTASILYNPYIKTCNPVSSSSSSTCNVQNTSNLQSYQTNPNTTTRMKCAIYVTRSSYNSS